MERGESRVSAWVALVGLSVIATSACGGGALWASRAAPARSDC